MPSHTFTRIGDWQASIDTNLASAASARAAGQPADELHASDYMIYAYLQTGQDKAAGQLTEASVQVFSRFDPARATGAAPASAAYYAHAAIPARYALERRDWASAAKLEPTPSRFPYADSITYFARGLGAAHLNDGAGARAAIASLDRIHDKLTQQGENYWAQQPTSSDGRWRRAAPMAAHGAAQSQLQNLGLAEKGRERPKAPTMQCPESGTAQCRQWVTEAANA